MRSFVPFDDFYNAQGEKRIARRFSHLPQPQTLALLQGLLENNVAIEQDGEIMIQYL